MFSLIITLPAPPVFWQNANEHATYLYSRASSVLPVMYAFAPVTTRLSSDRMHGADSRWALHCRPPWHATIGFHYCAGLLLPFLSIHTLHKEQEDERAFADEACNEVIR